MVMEWNMKYECKFTIIEVKWGSMWESICNVVKQYVISGEWKFVLHDDGIEKQGTKEFELFLNIINDFKLDPLENL